MLASAYCYHHRGSERNNPVAKWPDIMTQAAATKLPPQPCYLAVASDWEFKRPSAERKLQRYAENS